MYKLETPHHFLYSSSDEPPVLSCKGACKSVLFANELDNLKLPAFGVSCRICGGPVSSCSDADYKVLSFRFGGIKRSDFPDDPRFDYPSGVITGLSVVKPEFVHLSKRNWANC